MKKALIFAFVAALVATGCAGHGAAPISSSGADPVTVLAIGGGPEVATPAPVGVRLTGEKSIVDPRYGFVIGYFNGKTSLTSEIVHLTAGTQVKFFNVDPLFVKVPHTVSFLGRATSTSAPWPASFNGSSIRSPAGTAIGTAHFSTGALFPGQQSLIYKSGLPGFYMEGCAFHYNTKHMRTVIIVH